jgi:hypothetical protein
VEGGVEPTRLYATNAAVDGKNNDALSKLEGNPCSWYRVDNVDVASHISDARKAIVKKELQRNNFFFADSVQKKVVLKIGAQVMLLRNVNEREENEHGRLVNGSRGVVTGVVNGKWALERIQAEIAVREGADELAVSAVSAVSAVPSVSGSFRPFRELEVGKHQLRRLLKCMCDSRIHEVHRQLVEDLGEASRRKEEKDNGALNTESLTQQKQEEQRRFDTALKLPWKDGVVPDRCGDDLENHLRRLEWTEDMHTKRRAHVMRAGQENDNGGWGVKSFGLKEGRHPELFRRAVALMHARDASFEFDQIMVNHNWQCGRHKDDANSGPSYVISFGDYIGGKLLVEPPGVDDVEEQVHIDTHGRFVRIDGHRQYHEVAPFDGANRWTFIYYGSAAHASSTTGGGSATASSPHATGDDGPVYPLVKFVNGREELILPTVSTSAVHMLGVCTARQLPLKLAWAMTIHKSQGITLDHAIVDVSRAKSAGHVYVALSRVKTKEGLQIDGFSLSKIKCDQRVQRFYSNSEQLLSLWDDEARVPAWEKLAFGTEHGL